MKKTLLVLFFLAAFVIIIMNFNLPSGIHLMITLKLSPYHRNSYGYNYSRSWYTYTALSKFLYRHDCPGCCDLEVFVDGYSLTYDDRYILENAKIAYLLSVLADEYNSEGGADNADRDFLKWSITEVLSSGCDLNSVNGFPSKIPPLLYAVFSRQKDIVELLIDAGANPSLKINDPKSNMNGLSILEIVHKIRNSAKTDEDRRSLDEIIIIMTQGPSMSE